MAGFIESGDVQPTGRTVLATALLLRTVESLRFILDGCMLACGLKGEAVGEDNRICHAWWALMMMPRLGREPVSAVRRRDPGRLAVAGQDAMAR